MKNYNSFILIVIASLAIIPVLIIFFQGFHMGGVNSVFLFLRASLSPSLDTVILKSSINGISITFFIAFIGWF